MNTIIYFLVTFIGKKRVFLSKQTDFGRQGASFAFFSLLPYCYNTVEVYKACARTRIHMKYHQFFLAHQKLMLVDVGHYESEIRVKNLFHELLRLRFPDLKIHISQAVIYPIHYCTEGSMKLLPKYKQYI